MYILALLAFSAAYAGKIKYKDAQPIVIENTGKACVSFGDSDIGMKVVTSCPAKGDGTCPTAGECAADTTIQPRPGITKPGEYKPGKKKDPVGSAGEDNNSVRAD